MLGKAWFLTQAREQGAAPGADAFQHSWTHQYREGGFAPRIAFASSCSGGQRGAGSPSTALFSPMRWRLMLVIGRGSVCTHVCGRSLMKSRLCTLSLLALVLCSRLHLGFAKLFTMEQPGREGSCRQACSFQQQMQD